MIYQIKIFHGPNAVTNFNIWSTENPDILIDKIDIDNTVTNGYVQTVITVLYREAIV